MSLEQDIQQEHFRSEKQKAFINILYTYHQAVSATNAIFKDYGITRQQFNVLRILRGQHPGAASVGLIKERMLDKMSDASRIVERLRLKGLIIRAQSNKDKRAADISISKTGLQLLNQIDPLILEYEEQNINLSDDEATTLNTLLDKFRNGR